MRSRPASLELEKQIVLVGAGNAHLVFLKKWRMNPVDGVSVVLIHPTAEMPYSAMLPGWLCGEYRRDEVQVDLVRFCQGAGVRFLPETVSRLDLENKRVYTSPRRPPIQFEWLSLNVGQVSSADGLALRPISGFVGWLAELDAAAKRDKPIAVLGAGPSGCELAIALRQRYPLIPLHLFERRDRPAPQLPVKASRWLLQRFREVGVQFKPATELPSSRYAEYAAVLNATSGRPPAWLRSTGLGLDAGGFIRVNAFLHSETHPSVFAAGDVAAIADYPKLPKNGVYSVRMGETLYENVVHTLKGSPLVPFVPQSRYLALLNGGQGKALMVYGDTVASGTWARRWKNKLDREWMESFVLTPTEEEIATPMRCYGCAAKVPASALHAGLKHLDLNGREDATIEPGNANHTVHRTVDFISAFFDDPYRFGKITALHCASDLYAMNAQPKSALAILTLPPASPQLQGQWFEEVMAGAKEVAEEEGFVIDGGHTGEGAELAFGLSLTGESNGSPLFLKTNLRPGDRLVLTKPLGVATILAGWRRGLTRAEELGEALAWMEKSNRSAQRLFSSLGVTAATDVTGFGLAGHLVEMLEQSGVSARLSYTESLALPGALRLNQLGVFSSLFPQNQTVNAKAERALPALFFDPQTSGGLLAAIAPEKWEAFHRSATEAGLVYWEVGQVEPKGRFLLRF